MYLYNSKRTFQCETKYFQVPNSKCTFLGTIEIKHQEPTLFFLFLFFIFYFFVTLSLYFLSPIASY